MTRGTYSPEEMLIIREAIDTVVKSQGAGSSAAAVQRQKVAARALEEASHLDPIELETLVAALQTTS